MSQQTTPEQAGKQAAQKWAANTQKFLDEIRPVLDEISEHASSMPHDSIEDSAKVVEFATTRLKQFHEDRAAGFAKLKDQK